MARKKIRNRILKHYKEKRITEREKLQLKKFDEFIEKYGEKIYIDADRFGVIPSHVALEDRQFIKTIIRKKIEVVRSQKTKFNNIKIKYGDFFLKALLDYSENPMMSHVDFLELVDIKMARGNFFRLYKNLFNKPRPSYAKCKKLVRTSNWYPANYLLLETVSKISKYGVVEKNPDIKRTFYCNGLSFYVGCLNKNNTTFIEYDDVVGLDVIVVKYKGCLKGMYLSDLYHEIQIIEEELLSLKEIFANDI